MTLTGAYVKRWRKHRKMSARELGIALGYRGRELVKKVEGGTLPITDRFATRFETFKNRTQAHEYRERKIETRYALPGRIKILAKPRRCTVCREWFIFPSPNQKTCPDRECRRAHAAAKRREARRRRTGAGSHARRRA